MVISTLLEAMTAQWFGGPLRNTIPILNLGQW